MENIQRITLDIHDNQTYEQIYTKQYNKGFPIEFLITKDGEPFLLNDIVAVFEMTKPDGKIFIDYCEVNNNILSINVQEQMTAVDGKGKFQITLYDTDSYDIETQTGEVIISTVTGTMKIDRAAIQNKDIESSDAFDLITDVILQLEEVRVFYQDTKRFASESKDYATSASTSATNAKTSEENASNSALSASTSASNASNSATSASTSATNAQNYAQNAEEYMNKSLEYSNNSKSSATASANSASEANTSETNSKESEANAKKYSENAKTSETNAKESETASANSASSALTSSQTATTKANEASTSATTASEKAQIATTKASEAAQSASSALTSSQTATTKANEASTSAATATTAATNAQNYAVGDTNSAKYYYEQSKTISESFSGALRPMGTVTFANLPSLSNAAEGDMYNISNQFTTTSDFKEGSGNVIPAGSNVYKTSDSKWDILAGTPVTGVKGYMDSTYRRGNINISASNIGFEIVSDTEPAKQDVGCYWLVDYE